MILKLTYAFYIFLLIHHVGHYEYIVQLHPYCEFDHMLKEKINKNLKEQIKLHCNHLATCPHYQRHSGKFFSTMLGIRRPKFLDENQSPTTLVAVLLHL